MSLQNVIYFDYQYLLISLQTSLQIITNFYKLYHKLLLTLFQIHYPKLLSLLHTIPDFYTVHYKLLLTSLLMLTLLHISLQIVTDFITNPLHIITESYKFHYTLLPTSFQINTDFVTNVITNKHQICYKYHYNLLLTSLQISTNFQYN